MPLYKTRPTPPEGMEEIYIAYGLLQAEIIKGKLESNGVPTLLKYESLGPILGLTVDGLGQVQVLVPADKADFARSLLQEEEDLPDGIWEEDEALSDSESD